MSETFVVAFPAIASALAIWLVVRLVNRREVWAMCALAAVLTAVLLAAVPRLLPAPRWKTVSEEGELIFLTNQP